MDIEGLRLQPGEAVSDRDEPLSQSSQILQSLIKAKILHPVDADFNPQKSAELLVHAADEILAVDAQDVVAVVEFFQNAM